jgi:hypothetical protein
MLVTADRSKGLAARCRTLGVAFLSKPVQPQRLRAWLAAPEAPAADDREAGTIAIGAG